MRRGQQNVSVDQDEANRIREATKRREQERRDKEDQDRARKEEAKEKAREGLKAIVRKKAKKGIWEQYQYHIIFSILGVLVVFALFGRSSGDSRRPSEIPANEEDFIIKVNTLKRPYTVEANSFFEGWNLQDVRNILKNSFTKKKSLPRCNIQAGELPAEKFNFVEKYPRCVREVANQGNCSSAFAFAATGVFSDRYCINYDGEKTFVASAQHALACDKATSKGCQGGFVIGALDLGRVAGFVDEECLPYNIEKADDCESDKLTKCQRQHVGDYCMLEGVNEIKKQVSSAGPVVALVQVTKEFLVYKDGIYDESFSEYKIDGLQAVKIIGFDTSANGQEYWIVENSWGTSWGQGGYAHIKMNVHDSMIDKYAVSVTIAGADKTPPQQSEV